MEPSRLNLNTNILTLFAIYGTGIGMAVIWLIIEYLIVIISSGRLKNCTRLLGSFPFTLLNTAIVIHYYFTIFVSNP